MSAAVVSRTDLLMTYMEGLQPFLEDPDVTEIMVNPDGPNYTVFIERNGVMEEITANLRLRESHLLALARDIARNQLNREIDEENPSLSATLEDGSRIAITIPPEEEGVGVTIRKFRKHYFTVEEQIKAGTLTENMAGLVQQAVLAQKNILISGANGTGKTTILNTLASDFIPLHRRIVVIEDQVREVRLPRHRNKRFLSAGRHRSMPQVLEDALRHRIQTLIVGEVIGAEGYVLLNALNTGHSGSFATIHADSAPLAINRLTTCVVSARSGLSYEAIRMMIANSIHYVIQLQQDSDGRRHVSEFVRVDKYNQSDDTFHFAAIQ